MQMRFLSSHQLYSNGPESVCVVVANRERVFVVADRVCVCCRCGSKIIAELENSIIQQNKPYRLSP